MLRHDFLPNPWTLFIICDLELRSFSHDNGVGSNSSSSNSNSNKAKLFLACLLACLLAVSK